MNQKGFAPIFILIILAFLIMGLVIPIPYYQEQVICKPGQLDCPEAGWRFDGAPIWKNLLGKSNPANNTSKEKACTLEAKICPDGSSVGRTGPNCEFEECPVYETDNLKTYTSEEVLNWKTYLSPKYKYSFKYPNDWDIETTYKGKFQTDLEFTKVSPPESEDSYEGVSVKVLDTESQIVSIEWFKENFLKNYQEGTTLEQLGIVETDVQGLKALKDKNDNIYVIKSNHLYIVSWLHSGMSDTKNIRSAFAQIISTFKFTD